MNIVLKYILSRPRETCRCSNALLRIFSTVEFLHPEIFLGKAGNPFWRNRFPGCGTMVGGAAVQNHGATGRFLVFSLEKSLFHEIFCFPLSRGFYPQRWVFVQKQASVFPVRERAIFPGRERFWGGKHRFGPPKCLEDAYISSCPWQRPS